MGKCDVLFQASVTKFLDFWILGVFGVLMFWTSILELGSPNMFWTLVLPSCFGSVAVEVAVPVAVAAPVAVRAHHAAEASHVALEQVLEAPVALPVPEMQLAATARERWRHQEPSEGCGPSHPLLCGSALRPHDPYDLRRWRVRVILRVGSRWSAAQD